MSAILAALVNGMLVSVALLCLVWIALRVMPRGSLNAATRYAIWWAALVVTVALPFCNVRLGSDSAPSRPAPVAETLRFRFVEAPPVRSTLRFAPALQTTPRFANLPTPSRAPLFRTIFPIAIPAGPWPARILALWLLATSLMLIRLMASGVLLEHRKASASEPPPLLAAHVAKWIAICGGSNRRLRLAISRDISVPVVSGPVRAAILLPARLLDELSERDLEQIGIHEAAHFVRGDDYALWIQRTVEALFALHPVVHWICQRIDLEREIACDDFVISAIGNSVGDSQPYAACLARMVELSGGVRAIPVASAATKDVSHLARRVEMLFDITRHRGTRLLGLRLAVATACITALGWGAAQMPGFVAFQAFARPERGTPASLQQTPPELPLMAQASVPAVPAVPPVPPVPPQPSTSAPPVPAVPAVPAIPAVPALPAVPPEVASGSTDAAMVYVPVMVRDSGGRFVTGLGKEVFRVKEDGIEQTITRLAIEDSRADLFVLVGAEVKPDAALQPLIGERIQVTQAGDVVQVHGMGQLTPQNSVTGAIQTIQSRLGNISQRQMALVITNSSVVSQRHTASEPDDAVSKIDMPVYVLDIAAPDAHSGGG